MKKSLLFLIIFSALNLTGQSNLHLKNSRWINGYYEVEPLNGMPWPRLKYTVKFCTTTADTSINNLSYVKLFNCSDSVNIYHGALRKDSVRWYFHHRDSINEMLLYDFGLKVGDTLKEKFYYENSYYSPGNWDDLIVQQIDTVQEFGYSRRHVIFDHSGRWIEGVGNSQGFLWDPYSNISAYVMTLECYSNSDTTRYISGDYNTSNFNEACQLSFSLQENLPRKISIYPNPVKDEFLLSIPALSGLLELKIYDLKGVAVLSKTISETETNINPRIPSGTYILNLMDEGKVIYSRKLIFESK